MKFEPYTHNGVVNHQKIVGKDLSTYMGHQDQDGEKVRQMSLLFLNSNFCQKYTQNGFAYNSATKYRLALLPLF